MPPTPAQVFAQHGYPAPENMHAYPGRRAARYMDGVEIADRLVWVDGASVLLRRGADAVLADRSALPAWLPAAALRDEALWEALYAAAGGAP